DGKRYAVKRTLTKLKSKKDRDFHLREFRMFCKVDAHPNLITYYRAWQEDGYLYFQMELCPGGNVRTLQQSLPADSIFPETTIWTFIAHVGAALQHMHNGGVVHVDVKPENVFVSGHSFKVGDLGLAIEYTLPGSPRLNGLASPSNGGGFLDTSFGSNGQSD